MNLRMAMQFEAYKGLMVKSKGCWCVYVVAGLMMCLLTIAPRANAVDLDTDKLMAACYAQQVKTIIAPDGNHLLITADSVVSQVNIRTGRTDRVLRGHHSTITSMALSHDGRHLLTVDFRGRFVIWDMATGNQVHSFEGRITSNVSTCWVSSDLRRVVARNEYGGIKVWDTSNGREIVTLFDAFAIIRAVLYIPPPQCMNEKMAVSADGRYIAAADGLYYQETNTVFLWKEYGPPTVIAGDTGEVVTSVALSPDGRYLAIGFAEWAEGERKAIVRLWEISSGRYIRSIVAIRDVGILKFSADGRILFGVTTGWVYVWNGSDGTLFRTLGNFEDSQNRIDWINAISITSDGEVMALSTNRGYAAAYGIRNGMQRIEYSGENIRTRSENHFSIIAANSVGEILPSHTKQDIIRLYGSGNVQDTVIQIAEGDLKQVTIIKCSNGGRLQIAWESNNKPVEITIMQGSANWRTQDNITIGTTLADIEKINGQPFAISGYGRNIALTGIPSGTGRLSSEIFYRFRPTRSVNLEEAWWSSTSADSLVQRMGLVVKEIIVSWEYDNGIPTGAATLSRDIHVGNAEENGVIRVSIDELEREFTSNSVTALHKYRGRMVEISGRIQEFSLPSDGNGRLHVIGFQDKPWPYNLIHYEIWCEFSNETNLGTLAQFSKGGNVTIRGYIEAAWSGRLEVLRAHIIGYSGIVLPRGRYTNEPIVNVRISDIGREFDINAIAASMKYVGRDIEISGIVDGFQATRTNWASMILRDSAEQSTWPTYGVYCNYTDEKIERIRNVSVGQRVTIRGKIFHGEHCGMSIDNPIIVRVW